MPPNQSGSAVPGPHNTPNLRQAPVKYTPKHGPRTVGSNKKYGVRSGKPDPALKDLPPLPLFAGPVIDDASHGQISPSADNLPPLPASPGPAADNDCPSYGGMTTFERMLKLPFSDTKLPPKRLDVEPIKVFRVSTNRHRPFHMSDPSRQRRGIFNSTRNRKAARRSASNNGANSGDSDGDDEDEDSSLEDLDPTPPTTPSGSAPPNKPTTPSRNGSTTRFQSKLKCARDEASQLNPKVPSSPTLNDNPSTPPPPKRKRDTTEPITDSLEPQTPSPAATTGNRVSKRLRNSVSEAPMPPQPPSKRTRGEQRAADEKLRKDHEFDPNHAGRVAKEEIEFNSGSGPWKAGFLHTKPFDGSKDGQ